MDAFTRQLNLVALLQQSPTPLTFEQIRERLGEAGYPQPRPESARRTFERDKDDLKGMGVPIETRSVPDDPSNSAYTIDPRRAAVTDPGFTAAELAALRFAATALALRAEVVDEVTDATDGLRKYGGLSGDDTQPTVAEVLLDARLADIFGAILGHGAVGFSHGGRTRRVRPQQLAHLGGHWYLRCHDLDAGSARTYRVDRIDGAVLPLRDEGAPQGVAPAAPAGALRFRPWEFGGGEAREVEVRLDAPAAAVALAGDPDLAVARRDDGGTVVVLSVSNPEGLWPWMAAYLDRAEILGPPDVRERYVEHLRRFTAPAATAGGDR